MISPDKMFAIVSFTQTECKNLGLEAFYRTYVQRLQRSYLSIFFVIHTIIGMVHTIVLVATQVRLLIAHARDVIINRSQSDQFTTVLISIFSVFKVFIFLLQKQAPISPEVYCYLLSILVVWISLISSFKEDLIIRHSWIPNFASIVTVIALVVLDIIVPLYHSILTQVMPPLRPAYDSYVVFAIYIFLPVSDNMHSAVLGMSTTVCYLVLMGVMTYRLDEHIIVKVCMQFAIFG